MITQVIEWIEGKTLDFDGTPLSNPKTWNQHAGALTIAQLREHYSPQEKKKRGETIEIKEELAGTNLFASTSACSSSSSASSASLCGVAIEEEVKVKIEKKSSSYKKRAAITLDGDTLEEA